MANESLQRSRLYRDMCGVFLSGGKGNDSAHYAILENMYRDFDGDGGEVIESVPGFRRIASLPSPIRGIYSQKTGAFEYVLVVAGTSLFRAPLPLADETVFAELGTVADGEGAVFSVGEDLFYLDGTHLFAILPGGGVTRVADGTAKVPYVPTVFRDGAAYEQPNLLTDRVFEQLTVIDPEDLTYGTPGLIYRPIRGDAHTCTIVGITPSGIARESLYVPRFAEIGGVTYRVVSIEDGAFAGMTDLSSVFFSDGVAAIGSRAFADCPALASVFLSDSVESIGAACFSGCSSLYRVHLGAGIYSVGADAFAGTRIGDLGFAGDREHFDRIAFDSTELSALTPRCLDPYTARRLAFPVKCPLAAVSYAYVSGSSTVFTLERSGNLVTRVLLDFPDAATAVGKEIRILGTLAPVGSIRHTGVGFTDSHPDYAGSRADLIRRCRIARVFDGRVFLAGNPDFPNTVFYSEHGEDGQETGTYFGASNWFDDGIGAYPVRSLLSVGGELVVLKAGDEGCGSIYYHTPREINDAPMTRAYPTSAVHSGVVPAGPGMLFYDEAVFPSPIGITAVVKSATTGERRAQSRSRAVNEGLLTEDPAAVRMAMFSSYLAVLAGGSLYLADRNHTFRSPSGEWEYEWYIVRGVGTYSGDRRVYRYRSDPEPGYLSPTDPDGVATGTVYSETDAYGNVHTYVPTEAGRLSVYPTEEFRGGDFHPATVLGNAGGLLFFGTATGDLCVFNTDLRGTPPKRLADAPDFDPEEYRTRMGRRIHSDFYDFAGHAPRYAVGTRADDCDLPHLSKDTVPHSLTVRCRAVEGSHLTVEVSTERSGFSQVTAFPQGSFGFDSLDFSALSLESAPYLTIPLDEREKNWVEKQVLLYSDRFRAPIAVACIAYRYRVRGRIKTPSQIH